MKRIVLLFFFITSAVHLISLLFSLPVMVATATKPLLMLLLIAYYVSSTAKRSVAVIAALCCCWAGDVLLMQGDSFFIAGLVAFLAGHISYIIAYRQHRSEDTKGELLSTQKIRFSMPIILAGTGLVVILYPTLGDLQLPVLVYGVVIMVMVMNALFRYGRTSTTSFALVFLGALLFQVSDSLLAINKFYSPFAHGSFWVMLTYIGAQYLIVEGLASTFSRVTLKK